MNQFHGHCPKCCPREGLFIQILTVIGELVALVVVIHIVRKFW